MALATVRFSLRLDGRPWSGPGGGELVAHPGDIVGRGVGAAVRLLDPRISEARALVRLRGRRLELVGLTGTLSTEEGEVDRLVLEEGRRVGLAPGVSLEVRAVELPEEALAIAVGDGEPVELERSVYAIVETAVGASLVTGFRGRAVATIWSDGRGWCLQEGAGAAPRALEEGMMVVLGSGVEIEVFAVSPGPGLPSTAGRGPAAELWRVQPGERGALLIAGDRRWRISGQKGRILSILAEARLAGAAEPSWHELADRLWSAGDSAGSFDRQESRWSSALSRLNQRLADLGYPGRGVWMDGQGGVMLEIPAEAPSDL